MEIGEGRPREKGTRHVPASRRPRAFQEGAHSPIIPTTPEAIAPELDPNSIWSTVGEIPQKIIPPTPRPTFGVDTMDSLGSADQKPAEYLTVKEKTWLYDSPRWDPNRIRIARADKPTSGRILQRVEDPRDAHRPQGHRRLSIELEHAWTGKDGKKNTSRFWVNPKRGGFEGMPAERISRSTLNLNAATIDDPISQK